MTRLTSADIAGIADGLDDYDRELFTKTGCTIKELACRAAGARPTGKQLDFSGVSAAVVPVTSGQGRISGFAATVAAILGHVGFDAFVPDQADVGGLAVAFEQKAHLVLLSDDDRFVAINLINRRVVDNAAATGRGFAVALAAMAGGLGNKPVLVLGCGPVGQSAAKTLSELGARIGLYDLKPQKVHCLADVLGRAGKRQIWVETALDRTAGHYRYLFDATPAADIITAGHVTPQSMVAAPGVPCGLHPDARAVVGSHLIHDPLQIGVATMAVTAYLTEH